MFFKSSQIEKMLPVFNRLLQLLQNKRFYIFIFMKVKLTLSARLKQRQNWTRKCCLAKVTTCWIKYSDIKTADTGVGKIFSEVAV